MKNRCPWCEKDDLYRQYHDREWGVPVYDDRVLFEFIILEGVQAGLSWHTVLRKRENYRLAYDHFDFEKVARYDQTKIDELMHNEGLIRNKLKIEASVVNAQCFMEVRREFGSFSTYIWAFTGGRPLVNHFASLAEIPATTELSDQISKDMKKRGFKFVGSTVVYAHMQATGMVNDHLISCPRHGELSNQCSVISSS